MRTTKFHSIGLLAGMHGIALGFVTALAATAFTSNVSADAVQRDITPALSSDVLIWYLELYENRDINGDGFIGPPPPPSGGG